MYKVTTLMNKSFKISVCLILMFQTASLLHVIPSKFQRPVVPHPRLKARARWDLTELQSQNRWTNKQSITGLGLAGDQLKKFQENFDAIKAEAIGMSDEDSLKEWLQGDFTMVISLQGGK